jgi:hypothetical protein
MPNSHKKTAAAKVSNLTKAAVLAVAKDLYKKETGKKNARGFNNSELGIYIFKKISEAANAKTAKEKEKIYSTANKQARKKTETYKAQEGKLRQKKEQAKTDKQIAQSDFILWETETKSENEPFWFVLNYGNSADREVQKLIEFYKNLLGYEISLNIVGRDGKEHFYNSYAAFLQGLKYHYDKSMKALKERAKGAASKDEKKLLSAEADTVTVQVSTNPLTKQAIVSIEITPF